MIYGSIQGQSALGSLLRKIQEESMTNPAKVPMNASEASPIRAQVQGPLENPESAGSGKVVALKPELAPSAETPSPVAPTNTPMDATSAAAAAGMGPAAGSPTVVGPTNIPTPGSPESGIISPVAPKSATPSTPNTPAPGVSLPNANIGVGSKSPATGPSTSLSTSPLMPSSSKNVLDQIKNDKSTITKPSTYTNSKVGGTVESVGSGAGIGGALRAGVELLPSAVKTVGKIAGKVAGPVLTAADWLFNPNVTRIAGRKVWGVGKVQ